MISRRPIDPHRVRRITGSFSWLDHRLISDGHLLAMPPEEMLLYFFLVLVGDKNGVSFYSYDTICAIVKFDATDFIRARDSLIKKSLIACDNGRFQVLQLPSREKVLIGKQRYPMKTPGQTGTGKTKTSGFVNRGSNTEAQSLKMIFKKLAE